MTKEVLESYEGVYVFIVTLNGSTDSETEHRFYNLVDARNEAYRLFEIEFRDDSHYANDVEVEVYINNDEVSAESVFYISNKK